ncbi:cytosine permease [Arthrobacter sp. FB24]|uniref:cytosine permease n=1 Tax=Arthrobacter sp. (strain FB24) TaxID=290399 RepID=UPI0018DD96B2|nr:cytosine permease [Arthrobacter sp. FB24]
MIDYYVLRKQRVVVQDLFREQGYYTYSRGWNPKAIVSFLVSAIPAVVFALTPVIGALSAFSWFIGASLAAAAHYFISRHDQTLAESIHAAAEEAQGLLRQVPSEGRKRG